MALVLYNHDLLADAYKVRLFLAVLGVSCEMRTVAMLPGDGVDQPAFRRINPAGTVPTLVDDGLVVTRPEAILVHLAETRDPFGPWLPRDGASRAAVFDWLAFASGDLRAAEQSRLASLFKRTALLRDPVAAARAAFRVLETHLVRQDFGGRSFIAGGLPTIADIAIFPAIGLAADTGVSMDEFPGLIAWSRRIHTLSGFIAMSGVREMV